MQLYIDINCDMGEGYGNYHFGNDEAVMPYISSANIACGFHAGDPHIMHETVKAALQHSVTIGAHPGYPDLGGFGRRHMSLTPREIYELIIYQLGALQGFVHLYGHKVHHVKPHGALYNWAAQQYDIAEAIAEAVYDLDPTLILYGLCDSELVRAGKNRGLRVAQEAFADRTYQSDGTLTPRNQFNAIIQDMNEAVDQVINIVKYRKVVSTDGSEIDLQADTICVHGDEPRTLQLLQTLSTRLVQNKIQVRKVEKNGETD